MNEDAIKKKIEKYLKSKGWKVEVAFGRKKGIDIVAMKGSERWVIEVKGSGSLHPMRNNYFISVLGETLQRMNCPNTRYSIALPDIQKFRRLWAELPDLAKERVKIDCIFVSENKSNLIFTS